MRGFELQEKAAAIYGGIIALIKRGVNPYSIKVADIAVEANIGKGTIYDYFSSKEEAISKAILHYIGLQLKAAHDRVNAKASFQAKYFELLAILVEQAGENELYCKLLSPLGGSQDLYEHLGDYKDYILVNKSWIKKTFQDIFQAGEAEQIIKVADETDSLYREMAMTGALAAFLQYLYRPLAGEDTGAAKAASYQLLIKALN